MRRLEAQFAAVKCENQVAIVCNRNTIRAVEAQLDLSRIASGRNFEVVLKTVLLAVKREIYAGINFVVLNAAKLRHILQPARRIVSDEVTAVAGEAITAGEFWLLVPALQPHLNGCVRQASLRALREGYNCARGHQVNAIAGTMGNKLHVRVGLALIRLKAHWKLGKRGLNTGRSEVGSRGDRSGYIALEQKYAATEEKNQQKQATHARKS